MLVLLNSAWSPNIADARSKQAVISACKYMDCSNVIWPSSAVAKCNGTN